MTEVEAKTKWCPFARVSCSDGPVEGNHAFNRFVVAEDGFPPATHCIGSACMAWRHVGDGFGFCGLAGKP